MTVYRENINPQLISAKDLKWLNNEKNLKISFRSKVFKPQTTIRLLDSSILIYPLFVNTIVEDRIIAIND